MKTWRGIQVELDAAEMALADVGALLSCKFHDRAKELIIRLSKFEDVTIKYLIMGNGTYVLKMKAPWREVFRGQLEAGVDDMNIGDFNDSHRQPIERYELANPGICKVAQELDEILMLLTDGHYFELFDIDEERMAKLLGVKEIKKKKS